LREEHTQIGISNGKCMCKGKHIAIVYLKSLSVKGFIPRMMILGSDKNFKRLELVESLQVIGEIPLKGTVKS
jgi:hypothetical protein